MASNIHRYRCDICHVDKIGKSKMKEKYNYNRTCPKCAGELYDALVKGEWIFYADAMDVIKVMVQRSTVKEK